MQASFSLFVFTCFHVYINIYNSISFLIILTNKQDSLYKQKLPMEEEFSRIGHKA